MACASAESPDSAPADLSGRFLQAANAWQVGSKSPHRFACRADERFLGLSEFAELARNAIGVRSDVRADKYIEIFIGRRVHRRVYRYQRIQIASGQLVIIWLKPEAVLNQELVQVLPLRFKMGPLNGAVP